MTVGMLQRSLQRAPVGGHGRRDCRGKAAQDTNLPNFVGQASSLSPETDRLEACFTPRAAVVLVFPRFRAREGINGRFGRGED